MVEHTHCRQRAPVGIDLSSSGTSQLGMFDIQSTTKSKYYDHIVLLYLESRRCRYLSIIFACFYQRRIKRGACGACAPPKIRKAYVIQR